MKIQHMKEQQEESGTCIMAIVYLIKEFLIPTFYLSLSSYDYKEEYNE